MATYADRRANGARRIALAAACSLALLAGCGGGGGGSASGTASASPSGGAGGATSGNAAQLAIAQKVYDGTPRVPAGFYTDPELPGVQGTVATTHLKNSDVSAQAATLRHELCTDDFGQAIAWSEMRAAAQPVYADMVQTDGNGRWFEIVRVPRNDVSSRQRHRVFRCTYVDRTGTDLQTDSGSAGLVNARPLTATELRTLSEYLWQFTPYNNADHVALESRSGSGAGANEIRHVIEMGRLTRASSAGQCDRIDVLDWTHALRTDTGAMTRQLSTTQTFRARRVNGIVELCP